MLEQSEGVTRPILGRVGVNIQAVLSELDAAIKKFGARPVLLVASDDDGYAMRTVRDVQKAGGGVRESMLLSRAGNGTAMLADRFNQLHEQFYRFRMDETTCEIVNLRAIGYGDVPKPRLLEVEEAAGSDSAHAVVDEHEVYFGGQWLPTKIYDRSALQPGNRVDGPAVIIEFDSTTVVLAGYTAEVDRYLNLIINPGLG